MLQAALNPRLESITSDLNFSSGILITTGFGAHTIQVETDFVF